LLAATPLLDKHEKRETYQLVVLDWELAQLGHRAFDLGQMIGDLYEQSYLDKSESTKVAIAAFASGYGQLSDGMAFRTAMHAGIHLIHSNIRRPSSVALMGTTEKISEMMMFGVDLILEAWKKDKTWFMGTELACLFHYS
jgi:hypothetical protein